jgi:hypothetical protein
VLNVTEQHVPYVTLATPLLVQLAQLVLEVVLHVLPQQQIQHTAYQLELMFGLQMFVEQLVSQDLALLEQLSAQ